MLQATLQQYSPDPQVALPQTMTPSWLASSDPPVPRGSSEQAPSCLRRIVDPPIGSLSGGNVQRAVLACELASGATLLVFSNPSFGLDFSAVAESRSRLIAARNQGTAVLLISAELDEVLSL